MLQLESLETPFKDSLKKIFSHLVANALKSEY